MSHKLVSKTNPMDKLKWTLAFAAIATAVVVNQYFAQQALLVRVFGIIGLGVIALGVALTTDKGRKILSFAHEASIELRKVVWPSRQETIQTTMMVLAVVAIIGLILWGIDIVLLKIVSKLIGYGAS